jgi:hypothetical protein
MKLPESLDDLLESAASSPGERARRWEAVRRAVGVVSPHVLAGGLPRLRPRDLRIAFTAIDLHLFHAAYQAVFENERDARFAWSIDEDPCPGEAMIEHHSSEGCDVFEFVFYRQRLAEVVERHIDMSPTLDGTPARDALDVVLIILARCMLRAVAIVEGPTMRAVQKLHLALLDRLLPVEKAKAE